MTKNVLVLTSRFPYEGGEYFLESESKFWKHIDDVNLTVVPFFATSKCRDYPEWVGLHSPKSNHSNVDRIGFLARAIFSPFLYKELALLRRRKSLNFKTLRRAVLALSRILQFKSTLRQIIRSLGSVDLVYSYWNNNSAYAALLLKKEGLIKKVVARAHGSDLYRYAQSGGYMPFKDWFASDFDEVYCVSEAGKKYFESEYPIDPRKVRVSRLGVTLSSCFSKPSACNELNLLSLSNCLPVKRLDVILEGVEKFCRGNPDVKIKWTHIGDGPLLRELQDKAKVQVTTLKNLRIEFLGRVPNDQVLDFLDSHEIDVILNTSSSEGVPVSLMEAMARGIPAVAPDVGGVPEIVPRSGGFGFLMRTNPDAGDLCEGLAWALVNAKNNGVRCSAKRHVEEKFSAERNYTEFYDCVILSVLAGE